jgi:hypothetical protein
MREIEKEAAPLERTLARYNATQLQGDNLRFYPEAARAQERLAALRKEQENLKITARALEQAMLDGASVGEQAERVTRALETADRDAAKAADARKKAQEGLNAALEEGRIGQHEVAAKERQRVLDKDSKALAEQEKRRGKGKLTPEQEELLVTGDIEKQQAAARKRLADQEKGEDKQLLQDKRANNAALVSEGAASLTQFFGNNRSARIAQAIVDTYAAATRALAELGPIAGPVMAGVMIASGFKNIANMRKAEAGFDDPANDNVMRRFGMKWANDMASLLNQGFYSQVGALAGGGAGGGTTVYDQRTIHQGGTTHNYGGINGLMASSPTQFRRGLDRAMVKAVRFRGRTTMGRTGQ